ncbi:MAG: hypothetical protein A4E32_00241 [Methanomassiliicoccales archaeon PtaU1.Bin124]|nr:MAG: hypothetical protein A4E32_00241 [Methanomassiliicoccales archaeon PtaU1.Bin124]
MACLVCGNRTSAGASLCSRCFKRIEDPVQNLDLAADPMADIRFTAKNSAILRIGPSFVGEVHLDKGMDHSLTFDRMVGGADRSHIPSFIDKYFSDLGVGLVLTGEERVPSRKLIGDIITAAEGMELEGAYWGKACLRMGNIISLAVRKAALLPLEPSDSFALVDGLRRRAKAMYDRALKYPDLTEIAERNMAKMEGWAMSEGRA